MCRSERDTLNIEVDLPPVELSPNGRHHRQIKARAIAQYRRLVGFLAVAEVHRVDWQTPERARLDMVWGLKGPLRGSYHPGDVDNAVGAAKTLIDGLRDAGAIRDDNWASLELGSVTATFEEGPWVRVTIVRVA